MSKYNPGETQPKYIVDAEAEATAELEAADPSARVTRFEVIDWRHDSPTAGRMLTLYGVEVRLDYQDDGRTLKVFITDRDEE